MALIKGPFEVKWGDNVLADVEEMDVENEIDSEDFETVQGKSYEIAGAHKISATITLLASDIPALAALLPQYHVVNGGVMSTGETVQSDVGAIDVVPGGCDATQINNNFDIISCNSPKEVFRIVNARTEIDGTEFEGNKVRKVLIKILGESESDEATVQFFRFGGIAVVS